MKKIYLLAFSLLTIIGASAQDLANKIPADATAVVAVKGKNLTDLLSVKEFNQSYLGKKILKEISKEVKIKIKDIEQLGFDLTSTFYYFHQSTDSIGYNCYLLPIKNVDNLERILAGDKKKIQSEGNFRKFSGKDSSSVMLWNKELLLVVYGEAKRNFFNDSTISKRYNIFNYDYSASYATEAVTIDTGAAATDESAILEEAPVSVDSSINSYDSYYGDYDKMKTLAYGWAEKHAQQLINSTGTNSILSNASYLKSLDENAEVLIWVPYLQNIYTDILYDAFLDKANYLSGYKSMSAKLYLEQDRIYFTGGIEMDDEQVEIYNKIVNRKLNKRFLKYVNDDKLVGYMAYAINTQAYLEQYPKMLKKMFGNMDKMGDEISLGLDVFSLLLDEAAVANVVPGDVLFLLNGLTQKEYTYTGYEYDEDYNSIEVEKKGMHTIPDFLFMMSTKDPQFLEKLIAYGIKKKALLKEGDFYKVTIPESPFDNYLMIKDGILFWGTSHEDMLKIAQNTYEAKLSKEHKKLMTKHNFASFFSPQSLSSSLVFSDEDELKRLNKVLNKLGDMAMKSNKVENNTASFDAYLSVPNGYTNSLQYLFSMIEESSK